MTGVGDPTKILDKDSTRQRLRQAMELAREAVRLDSSNEDPLSAIESYQKCTDMLNHVIDRIHNGDITNTQTQYRSSSRNEANRDEELKRLTSIVSK